MKLTSRDRWVSTVGWWVSFVVVAFVTFWLYHHFNDPWIPLAVITAILYIGDHFRPQYVRVIDDD